MKPRNDALLISAKVILKILAVVLAVASICLVFGSGAVLADLNGYASRTLYGAPPQSVYWLAGVYGIAGVMMVVGLLFMLELIRIVDSVGEGDPFRADNADRLTRMGWLALAFQIGMAVVSPLTYMLSRYLDDVDVEEGLSIQGVTLILLLFVLARVFRHGAAMRDDLEGTV